MTMKIPAKLSAMLSEGLSEATLAFESKDGIENAARMYYKLLAAVAKAFSENRAWAFEREEGNIEFHIYFNPKELEL